jgi:hypothetical protein
MRHSQEIFDLQLFRRGQPKNPSWLQEDQPRTTGMYLRCRQTALMLRRTPVEDDSDSLTGSGRNRADHTAVSQSDRGQTGAKDSMSSPV